MGFSIKNIDIKFNHKIGQLILKTNSWQDVVYIELLKSETEISRGLYMQPTIIFLLLGWSISAKIDS